MYQARVNVIDAAGWKWGSKMGILHLPAAIPLVQTQEFKPEIAEVGPAGNQELVASLVAS